MKIHTFESYFTGNPLKKVQYSYNDTTIFEKFGQMTRSAPLTTEQVSRLNAMPADDFIGPAFVFAEAYGSEHHID